MYLLLLQVHIDLSVYLGFAIQGDAEFVIDIHHFKFAGGEGNTQFGSDITDVSTYPPLQTRLRELWRLAQLRKLFGQESSCQESQGDGSTSNYNQIEKAMLKSHDNVFVPDDMEKKLAEIPGKRKILLNAYKFSGS